eukprot:scaffold28026_cov21-Tisochrysis_lutea.AAC.2
MPLRLVQLSIGNKSSVLMSALAGHVLISPLRVVKRFQELAPEEIAVSMNHTHYCMIMSLRVAQPGIPMPKFQASEVP